MDSQPDPKQGRTPLARGSHTGGDLDALDSCASAAWAVAPERLADRRRLAAAFGLTLVILGLEVAGGLWTGSLALLSDAGHMLTDAVALLLSLAAVWVTTRPADVKRTFGYYRFEILCALLNGAILIPVSVGIAIEAYRRFRDPPQVDALPMMGIAAAGLFANGAVFWLLRRSQGMNVRGAMLHVVTDALSSFGVIAAGAILWATGWRWVDPVASIAIAAIIVIGAIRLIREAVDVLLEAVPRHLDLASVLEAMQGVDGVTAVHDLHIWTLSSKLIALSAHLVVRPAPVDENDRLLGRVQALLMDRFGIDHATLQIESRTFAHANERTP